LIPHSTEKTYRACFTPQVAGGTTIIHLNI
jgi:hypothetical protein